MLPDFHQHLHMKDGFCYPDWNTISDIIENNVSELEWNSAWLHVARLWVERIRDQLDEDYHIYETPNFLILSQASKRIANDICKSYEESLKQILLNFDGVASDAGYGKHVVLMFGSIDDYYGYLYYFYPDGDHPMSGGVCLSGEGYVHFAFPTTDYSSYRTVLVHELTHGCLGHLPLPTWVNEALAMRMEQSICETATFHLDQEIYDKHIAHWNEETIQEFWTGESWEVPGNSFELSYNLAQILWRKIEVDIGPPRSEILDFISKVHFEDAGESAFHEIFDLSLGDLVEDFLGNGNWEPKPKQWPNNSVQQMDSE